MKKLNFLSTVFIIFMIFTPPLFQVIHPDLIGERGLGGVRYFPNATPERKKLTLGEQQEEWQLAFPLVIKDILVIEPILNCGNTILPAILGLKKLITHV